MKIVTVEQMRELERRAVDAGVPEDSLMESAGLAVARRVTQLMDGVRGKRVVVLVGGGNNGGDGLVAARYLADWGALVTLYMTSPRRREDKFEACRARRVRIVEASDDPEQLELGSSVPLSDVVLDAVLGIGGEPPLGDSLRAPFELLRSVKQAQPELRYVALDIPTGVGANGACDDASFRADLTLTLGAPKVGLYRFPGAAYAGLVEVLGIGLPEGAGDDLPIDLADLDTVSRLLPRRPLDSHKGTFGNLLLLAGSRRFIGAPVLAASAAYRTGAGLVTLAAPETASRLAGPHVLEQVHLPLPETPEGHVSASAGDAVASALAAAEAAVIGPGLGNVESVRDVLQSVLLSDSAPMRPVVLDADALNALSDTYEWWERLRAPAVLTPHPGEMARLLATSVASVEEDRVATALSAAARWRQVVVLKGAYTVIASPSGRASISPFANPALATAGTGDVLAGVIGSLLAQGLAPFDAAVAGVYIHAAAASRISSETGSSGLMASDLLPEIPRAMHAIRADG